MRPSMGSVGDAYDNAMCESFFATLECELLDRRRFRTPRRGSRCSSSSRASTTRDAVIHQSGISLRSSMSVVTRSIPMHTSMPPCSRRSRTSPPGGPEVGPSLTAAARDGRTGVRAGMKEWLRWGPNKRMTPNRRAKCRQTRYPDPKPSTVHENGASPFYSWGVHSPPPLALGQHCVRPYICRGVLRKARAPWSQNLPSSRGLYG